MRTKVLATCVSLFLLLPGVARAEVLFDSTPSVVGFHPTVQDFEAMHDDDDAEVADDFTVPPNETWTLQRVFVDGRQPAPPGPGTTNLVNVALYTPAGALPAATAFYAMQLTSDAGTPYPDFDLALPGTPVLGPGTYWFGAQARMDFNATANNVWFWGTTPTQRGNLAAYRNPGDGFGSGCVTWTAMNTCVANVTNPDVTFRLEGTRVVQPPPPAGGSPATPATPVTPAPAAPKCKKGQKLKKGKCVKKKRRKKK